MGCFPLVSTLPAEEFGLVRGTSFGFGVGLGLAAGVTTPLFGFTFAALLPSLLAAVGETTSGRLTSGCLPRNDEKENPAAAGEST